MNKFAKVAINAVATGALIFVAAPTIGGAIGAIALGWHGCVAVSSGLALVGFGAKAAGGLGMLGGKIILSIFGGLFGAAKGVAFA